MQSITFPQANCELAKDQPEYDTLHVHVATNDYEEPASVDEQGQFIPHRKISVPWSMTACFELTDAEVEQIVRTRKLWYTQMVFGQQFHPISMSTQDPFAEVAPATMQSAFILDSGTRILLVTGPEGVQSFKCDDNWQPQASPIHEKKFAWTDDTMESYHKRMRAAYGMHRFIPEQSTPLT